MIVFDVSCSNDHVFEGWFKDTDSFGEQVEAGVVTCPVCGDSDVRKALMAPNVAGTRKGKDDAAAPNAVMAPPDGDAADFIEALHELKKHVEENSDYVGDTFPEEARKIHHGEVEKRNIYGDASNEDVEELREEGIEISQMPWVPRHDS